MANPKVTPDAVVLFAKAPLPGRVKTRLQPPLTPEEAADLHKAFVADAWAKLQHVSGATPYFYSDIAWQTYPEPVPGGRVRIQRGDDLGARMYHCFADLHQAGHQRILIVGSDSPSLPVDYLVQGFTLMRDADLVLGPADDGGYYAIGSRRPHPGMFKGVTWSSDHTLRQTEAALHQANLRVRLLPGWYDIDTFGDLERLAAEPQLPAHSRAFLQAHPEVTAKLQRLNAGTVSSP